MMNLAFCFLFVVFKLFSSKFMGFLYGMEWKVDINVLLLALARLGFKSVSGGED